MTSYTLRQLGGKSPDLTENQMNYLTKLFNWYKETKQTELPLKPIKQYFKAWTTIDDDMDYFVKMGFLERYDRRYRFLAKEIDLSVIERIQQKSQPLDSQVTDFDESVVVSAITSYYNNLNLSFFSKSPNLTYAIPSASFGENYLFQDTLSSETFGLASHFNHNENNIISEQIGDVNQSFFVDMSGAVIAAKQSESSRKIKEPNLFLTILRQLGYFQDENDKLAETVSFQDYVKVDFEVEVEKVSERLGSFVHEAELELDEITKELLYFLVIEKYISELRCSKQVIRFI